MMNKIAILILVLLVGCNGLNDRTITIGTPRSNPKMPVRSEYAVLYDNWRATLPLDIYVERTDSLIADLKFKVDSLLFILKDKNLLYVSENNNK